MGAGWIGRWKDCFTGDDCARGRGGAKVEFVCVGTAGSECEDVDCDWFITGIVAVLLSAEEARTSAMLTPMLLCPGVKDEDGED